MNAFAFWADSNFLGIAENPLWNELEQMLYWKGSDKDKYNLMFRKCVNADCNNFERYELPVGAIGGFTFTRNGELLIFAQHGRVWRWHVGNDPVLIAELPNADDKTYFNDVITDPEGRVYCGVLAHDFLNQVMRGKHGSLWRFDPDDSFHCLETETGTCPNGMGFSPDLQYFYFAVSDEKTVYRYDYDQSTVISAIAFHLFWHRAATG